MANETVLVFETVRPVAFRVANASAIERGALTVLADPMTLVTHTNEEGGYFGGVAATEKIASDGKITIAIYRQGIFKMVAKAAITAGDAVSLSDTANKVKASVHGDKGADIIGFALTTAAAGDNTILVDVRPGCNNNAYA